MKKIFLSLFISLVIGNLTAQRLQGKKVVGYIPSWTPSQNLNYANLTHAMYAFLETNPDGSLKAPNEWQQRQFDAFIINTEPDSIKRFVAIGGASSQIGLVATDADRIHTFADTLVKYCKYHNIDGIDVDWEALSTQEEKEQFSQFIDTLDVRLHSEGIEMSITLTYGNWWGQWFEDAALHKADWLQIMVYDQTGTWGASPYGNHASFQHLLDAESYWVDRGFTRDKLVMGVPLYGYKFNSTAGGQATGIPYKTIVSDYPVLGDELNLTPGDDLTHFNGPDLIKEKTEYIIDNDFGGIMMWDMSQDATGRKSLHQVIVCALDPDYCHSCDNVDLEMGLIAKYDFSGEAIADVGGDLPEIDLNTGLTFDRFGKEDSAYQFVENTYINMGAHSDFDKPEMTFSVWINTSRDDIGFQTILSKWDNATNTGYDVYLWDEKLSILYKAGNTNADFIYFNSSTQIKKHTWYHIVASFSEQNGSVLYVNGQKVLEDHTPITMSSAPGNQLYFGQITVWDEDFYGKMDDIRIYDYQLSLCDVEKLFYDSYSNISVTCESTIQESGCESIEINGTIYKTSGTYIQYIEKTKGCDSIINIEVDIEAKPWTFSGVYSEDNSLYARPDNYEYQWYRCSDNSLVDGATSQQFIPTDNDEYKVIVSDKQCEFTTKCDKVIISEIETVEDTEAYHIFPNPANDYVNIIGDGIDFVELYNITGQIVLNTEKHKFQVSSMPKGLYFVIINLSDGRKFSQKLIID